MGFLTNLLNIVTFFDGSSYIQDAKEWGDDVWNDWMVYAVEFCC